MREGTFARSTVRPESAFAQSAMCPWPTSEHSTTTCERDTTYTKKANTMCPSQAPPLIPWFKRGNKMLATNMVLVFNNSPCSSGIVFPGATGRVFGCQYIRAKWGASQMCPVWLLLSEEEQCCKAHWGQPCGHDFSVWYVWQSHSNASCHVLPQKENTLECNVKRNIIYHFIE